jgi:predicted flap endonuclease-1-like 5' DNA nuclease
MDFTTNEWVILALVFILGWLLGLASRSDKRWRGQYEQERTAHATLRRDHDALRRDYEVKQREHDTRMAAAAARPAPAEHPVAAAPIGAVAAPASVLRDDLTRIDGIDAHDEVRLNDAGIHSFRDVSAIAREDAAALESRLGFSAGRIDSQRWREQAAMLADGRTIVSGTTERRI